MPNNLYLYEQYEFEKNSSEQLINCRNIIGIEKILGKDPNLVHSWIFPFAMTAAQKWEKVGKTCEKWSPVLSLLFSGQLGVKHSLKQNRYLAHFFTFSLQHRFSCDWSYSCGNSTLVLKIWSCKVWLWQKYQLVVRLPRSILVQSWNFVFGIIADNNSALCFL